MKSRKLLTILLLAAFTLTAGAQRVTDKLTRGLVAIPSSDQDGVDKNYGTYSAGMFVSWRKLPSEYFDTKYNLYRNGSKINSEPLSVCNYQDASGTASSTYKVVPVVRGTERTDLASAEVTPWPHMYWDIPVKPVVNRNGVDVDAQYSLNDCSVADVDGDGEMEFVVKRRNDSGLNVAGNTTTFNLHECYKMDGTRLWWIDMGPNMMAGPDEQFDLILYDWDCDGKAEALMRGADNMIIHTATGKTIKIGDMNYYAPRDEYTREGKEYLLYINGETGEPYGWDGSENWTPMAYPLPRFETGEAADVLVPTRSKSGIVGEYEKIWGAEDTGHRATKHYFGAPYLDGRNPSIFLGRGCYTRHKFCALNVNPTTHELTQAWRWNCYDSRSPWFGNGFHNFAIADVDMDGRDEIVFGSMIIDDNGYGLSTTGFGHGDAQHCGDLDPYRWGLEQFVCLEGSTVPGIAYTDGMTSTLRFTTGTGADNGRCMAGNFQNTYPGAIGNTFGYDVISLVSDKVITGMNMANDDYWNMRLYWDGDLLDEFMDSPGVEKAPYVYKAPGQKEVGTNRSYTNGRCWGGYGNLNNSSKNNPSFLGDIIGDWREELVIRQGNSSLRIYMSNYPSPHAITSLWYDHEYRNGMTWQSVGYNQPPHPSFFLGEMEGITNEPPAITLEGRTEVTGSIGNGDQLLVSGYEDKTISVQEGAAPNVLYVNTPAWVKGSGSQQATSATPKLPAQTVTTYTTTLTGGAFGGAMHLVKQGEGILVLPAVTEKHTGNTDIWNGTLQFDGTLESSPLWLNRHTTLISDGGKFMAGLKADYNATVYPGGKNSVGSITTSKLEMGFGSRFVLDYAGGAFDQLNASSLSVEAKTEDVWITYGPRYKAPVLQFVGVENIAAGTYDLGTVGQVEGDLSQIVIEGFGTETKTTLAINDGKLQLIVGGMRPAGTAIWNGTATDNEWQQAASENFLIDGAPTYSAKDDHVIFNDDAANTTVQIKGAVSPADVTFNNDTKTYTVTGDSIVGEAPIVKNGAGIVNLNNWNHSGNTTINGGTLSVSMLANNSGQDFGSLGDASKQIYLNDGATLQTNGIIITDQTLNVSGEVNIDVPSGKSVIINKAIKGPNAIINKTGAGSMETGTETNTYSKLVIKAGTVSSNYSSSNIDMLPKTIEFQGGTLWGANMEGGSGVTNTSNFVVPAGKTGTFYGSFRGVYSGTLTGSGTFNVYTGGVRCYFNGNWSNFEGTINIGKNNRQNKKSYDPEFLFGGANGLPKATVNVNAKARLQNQGKNVTVKALGGTGAVVGSGTWIVNNDEDFKLTTEVGITSDRTDDYGGTISKSATPLTKRGKGKMTISTVGNMYGTFTIEDGTVMFNDSKFTALLNGATPTIVKGTGRLFGQGQVNSIRVMEGGLFQPCASIYTEASGGTIQCANYFQADAGSTTNFYISSSKNSYIEATNAITFNGALKVILASSYTPKVGASFTLWKGKTFSGTIQEIDLPALPAGMEWDTSAVQAATGVLRIIAATPIENVAAAETVGCKVYTVDGVLVRTFTAKRNAVRSAVNKLGLAAGSYVVAITSGDSTETETVLVK